MNATEIKAARQTLGLTQPAMAHALGSEKDGHYSTRAIVSWENGERKVPPAVAKLVRLMLRAGGK